LTAAGASKVDSSDGSHPVELQLDYKAYPLLVVDDDPDIVLTFEFNFAEDFTVIGATSGTEALEIVRTRPVAVLVCDQRMPDMHGAEVIRRAVELRPDLVPIVLTGFTDYQALVKAVNTGRIHRYIPKPFDADELRLTLRTAIETHHLVQENARLLAELSAANERLASENLFYREREAEGGEFETIVGKSPAIEHVRKMLRRVVDSDATVLLEGPTGTGKELLARAIHQAGPRRDKLFVAVNCGAKTEELLEAELFGHVKGAFTGAVHSRKGLFQLADGGTIFLDEIGEASPRFQTHLLRVLDERKIQRIGDDRPSIPVDVRVLAATNRDLEAHVKAGSFREDLYFRLEVFPIRVPSLGERREDIPLLVAHFLEKHCRLLKRPVPDMSAAAMIELEAREYRGNVRELSNLIERALLLTDPGEAVLAEHLFDRPAAEGGGELAAPLAVGQDDKGLYDAVAEFERAFIADRLDRHGGSRTHTAKSLGISTRWLIKKMQRHGLKADDGNDGD